MRRLHVYPLVMMEQLSHRLRPMVSCVVGMQLADYSFVNPSPKNGLGVSFGPKMIVLRYLLRQVISIGTMILFAIR